MVNEPPALDPVKLAEIADLAQELLDEMKATLAKTRELARDMRVTREICEMLANKQIAMVTLTRTNETIDAMEQEMPGRTPKALVPDPDRRPT